VRTFLLLFLLTAPLLAQPAEPEGICQGYDGELRHVARKLIAREEPPGGVRSSPGVPLWGAAGAKAARSGRLCGTTEVVP
jgi:hypothetical protein